MLKKLEEISTLVMVVSGSLNHLITTRRGLTKARLLNMKAGLDKACELLSKMLEQMKGHSVLRT